MSNGLYGYLDSDENILARLGPFIATDQRVIRYEELDTAFLNDHSNALDLSYGTITSVGIQSIKTSLKWLIGVGVFLVFIGVYLFMEGISDTYGILLMMGGIIIAILGYFYQPKDYYFGLYGKEIPTDVGFMFFSQNNEKANVQSPWVIQFKDIPKAQMMNFVKVIHKQLRERGLREKEELEDYNHVDIHEKPITQYFVENQGSRNEEDLDPGEDFNQYKGIYGLD